MGRKKDFKAEEIIEAIKGTRGIKRNIADKLGCHRNTVAGYIRDMPTVRQAWLNERMLLKDQAILGLEFHLRNHERWAIRFVLTHMNDEGEFETPKQRSVISTEGDQPLLSIVLPDNGR